MLKKVGMAYCVGCHTSYTPDVYAAWLRGAHGNFNKMDATTNVTSDYTDFITSFSYPADSTQFDGFPSNESSGKACLSCHGPWKEDNKKVAGFPLVRADGTVDTINASQAQRPIVGCEGCHGSGKNHISAPFGRVPAYAEPSAVQCGDCHNKNFPADHLTVHPAGAAGANNPGIYEAYQASAHPSSVNEAVFANEKKTEVRALCAKCHTDQGARIYRAIDGDATTLPARLSGEANHKEFAPVQCRTCHNAHDPSALLESATEASGAIKARSAEFNTCTNCHQLLNDDDTKITPFHSTHANSITTNHYDDPATAAIEGYNVNRAASTACSNCHNPHVTSLVYNKEWAESGHGHLESPAWDEYEWKHTANRQVCQRCHTTTAFVNYFSNPSTYNPANNDFSYLNGAPGGPVSLQKETLYCNGCHSDSAFNRRSLASVPFPSGASLSLGDDSNICMACHQGRESGVSIENRIKGPAPYSFVNVHYLPASAVLFGSEAEGGFQYPGKVYAGRNTFSVHRGKLDTCVKCHMRTDSADHPDHRFMPEVSDCAECHTGITKLADIRPAAAPDYDGDGDTVEGLAGEIETLRAKLLTEITAYAKNTVKTQIVYDPNRNPYWFVDNNGNGVRDANETTSYAQFDARLLEAAYNYQVSVKEPCGHIHNHKYILQLVYDSLQDLGGDLGRAVRPL